MSEFEKELEKNMKLGKVAHERESLYSDFLVSKRDIERIFEDWQPPKPLVEVPQIMADFIEERKEELKIYGAFLEIEKCYGTGTELYNLVFQKPDGQSLFARAWIYGYTVEKEKKYILKHIDLSKFSEDSSLYLSRSIKAEVFGKYDHMRVPDGVDVSEIEQCHFTQEEIDKLHSGSYEQIEVNP